MKSNSVTLGGFLGHLVGLMPDNLFVKGALNGLKLNMITVMKCLFQAQGNLTP